LIFYGLVPVAAWLIGHVSERRRIPLLFCAAVGSLGLTLGIIVISIGAIGSVDSTNLQTFPSFIWAFVPGMIVAELDARHRLTGIPAGGLLCGGLALIALSVALDPPPYLDLPAAL